MPEKPEKAPPLRMAFKACSRYVHPPGAGGVRTVTHRCASSLRVSPWIPKSSCFRILQTVDDILSSPTAPIAINIEIYSWLPVPSLYIALVFERKKPSQFQDRCLSRCTYYPRFSTAQAAGGGADWIPLVQLSALRLVRALVPTLKSRQLGVLLGEDDAHSLVSRCVELCASPASTVVVDYM